ncbi:hypothetical protein DFQ27_001063 [Actinomortierella ambigua]|uniref:JmjC domain-containing protein n=1 Tax=Actinomortierella ambigua TaxID=1343610 RepID=A0A9P6QBJ2_9FUNG|nr:hypothetical protein DFQ27_001063 [Actinomortierella ambigua]
MPAEMVAETLLLYLGIGGTWTPAHFDQCATLAHSLMLYADGKSETLGDTYALWFVVPPSHYAIAKAFWAHLGRNLHLENYFATLIELSKAKFPIYVIRQRVGDLVVLPPRAVHQVINVGGASIKFAWNRATAETLQLAVNNVIPMYRLICRPESYRVLLVVKYSLRCRLEVLLAFDTRLERARTPSRAAVAYALRLRNRWHRENFAKDYLILLRLYAYCLFHDAIMPGIIPDADHHQVAQPAQRANKEPTRCDFCQTDIWNLQFVCPLCPTNEYGHDMYLTCVGRGRTCGHPVSQLQLVEVFPTDERHLLLQHAAMAWNTSTKLARLRTVTYQVLDFQAPATARDPFSAASVAYLRHVGPTLQSQNVACHRCGVVDRNAVHMKCQSLGCLHVFCEECMYTCHGDQWSVVVADRATRWNCYVCKGECMCATCRAEAPVVRRGRRTASTPNFEWFASPGGFNRPAISDPPLE